MNRIEPILDELNGGTMDQEDQMVMIMDALSDTVTPIPTLEHLYFRLQLKHLNLDTINTHLLQSQIYLHGDFVNKLSSQKTRQYTWNEIAGQVYIVQRNELDDLLSVRYGKFITK